MDEPQKKRRGPIGVVRSHPVLGAMFLLLVIYVGAYFQLVWPMTAVDADPAVPRRTFPGYALRKDGTPWQSKFVQWLFLPAYHIDRIIRPEEWKPIPPPDPLSQYRVAPPPVSSPFGQGKK